MFEGNIIQTSILVLQGVLPVLGLLWPFDIFCRRLKEKHLHPPNWQLLLLWLSSLAFMATSFSYPNSVMIAYHAWIPYLLDLLATIFLFSLIKKTPRQEKTIFILTCLLVGLYRFTASPATQSNNAQ